jgi:hypothetical protein
MREDEQRNQRQRDGKKTRVEQERENNRKTRKGESERGGRTLQRTTTTRASFTEGQVVWYLPPRHVLKNNFVARGVSPTDWDQMQNENLQMEPGRFRATVIRPGSHSDCTICVHGGQYSTAAMKTRKRSLQTWLSTY